MFLQTLLRWLLPREDHFYDFLERQAEVGWKAAQAMAKHLSNAATTAQIRAEVEDLEHQGDAIGNEMLAALSRTFVTPIDREDLQRLSKKLDDIPDYINLAARACVLYGVERPTKPMTVLIEKLEACTRVLKEAVPKLRRHAYTDLIKVGQEIHALEKEGDVVFRDAISALFHDPTIDAKVILREKEVLEDLEDAINTCEQVAETLTNIAVKHA